VDIFLTRGRGLQVGRSVFFGAKKTSDFSKFMMCPHGQVERELSQYGHFADKKESIFLRFCADVFYGRSLIAVANSV